MYIDTLKIANLRSVARTGLRLNTPATPDLACPNVSLLVGGNGIGKTSILRAVVLGALGPALGAGSGFVPTDLVRRMPAGDAAAAPPATITARIVMPPGCPTPWAVPDVGGPLELTTLVDSLPQGERLRWRSRPAAARKAVERLQAEAHGGVFLVLAYGATRRAGSADRQAPDPPGSPAYRRVAGLFEEPGALLPLAAWLPRCAGTDRPRHDQVVQLINQLLPAACRMTDMPVETPAGRQHLFEMNGAAVGIHALSNGYRACLGWVGDMLFHLCQAADAGTALRDIRGIVLVDEIDLHLHPQWQRTVVPTLARALPCLQLVFTSHSPLVVGSLQSGNLLVLDEENGATVVRRLSERVHGRSAEQILLSPYFGLDSTRAPEVSTALRLLAGRAGAGDARAAAQYLDLLSGGLSRQDVAAVLASPRKSRTGEP